MNFLIFISFFSFFLIFLIFFIFSDKSSKFFSQNELLSQEKIFYPLEKTLKYNEDYVVVNRDIWNVLVDRFQASKELPSKNFPIFPLIFLNFP